MSAVVSAQHQQHQSPQPAPSVGLHAIQGALGSGDGPPRRLEIPPYDLAAALALERELGIGHVLAQVLARRGLVDPRHAAAFLDPRDEYDPGAFTGIERVVELVKCHVEARHRIVVHGDYDVDGVCATAIMVRALRSLGADVGWFLPSRLEDGYGLSGATIELLASRGTDLLLTVDCGITAVAEVLAARRVGLDVVVTDHHAPRPDGRLPDCELVHPAVCGYPCPDLCGTGVAYKLAQALGAASAAEDLELVALATVADLVPLAGENRRLVREGLSALANTGRPGLRALMKVSRSDPSGLDTQTLGYRLAPRINAAGRLARPDAGLELLLTEDHARAAEIAAELDAVNSERRAVEHRILWEAEQQVAQAGERSAFVLAGEDWHPGVIGIVASRLVERHHRPTIMIALDGQLGTGSGRSIPGFDLLAALHSAADQMERYGGHRAAAGMTVRRELVETLRERIEQHAEAHLTPELLTPRERVDAVASGSELQLSLAEELAKLEPCGIGNPRPRLLIPGSRFVDLRPMGEGRHARFLVSSGGTRARAIAFGCEGRLAQIAGKPVDATFRLERDAWNGAVEARLVLRHVQACDPAAIEVLGEPDPYLRAVLRALDHTDDQAVPPPESSARVTLDRRGQSPLAVLADALASAEPVLAVCSDVPRRLDGLRSRIGGFALISYPALAASPIETERFRHLVALDPPSSPAEERLLDAGCGFTHLSWGEAELRFAEQMHELEYGLRAPLVALYRGLRGRGRATGEELEHLLRGDGRHGRPARLAARLVKVLVELGLVSLDPDLPALAVASSSRTELECSPSYRAYAQRYEDGRRFLSSANLLPRG
jgi:single-stranded-DNA-specific exonuclease